MAGALFEQAANRHRAGDLMGAEALFRDVLAQDPAHVAAHDMLGVVLLQQGRFADAAAVFEKTLTIVPNRPAQMSNLGVAYQNMGQREAALNAFESAVAIDPGYARGWCNRGDVLNLLGRPAEGLVSCARALSLNPNLVEAHCNRANALCDLKRYEEALAGFTRALTMAPNEPLLFSNRANVLERLGRYDEALADCRQALARNPDSIDAFVNRSNVYKAMGRFDEALADCQSVLARDVQNASARWNKALIELQLARFAEGWADYEARWRVKPLKFAVRSFAQPAWDGAPAADNTLLVYAEQGLGDSVQFCRFLTRARKRVGHLIVEVQPALLPLFRTLNLDADFVAAGQGLPDFDVQCAMLSLPYVLGLKAEEDLVQAPYLASDPPVWDRWQARLGPKTKPRVGLCWSGNPVHADDAKRSIAPALLTPLLQLPFEFHAVHKPTAPADIPPQIAMHTDELIDFADTAALIGHMDLTITVDTVIAHLAGALGAPVWVMLPHVADWRWQTVRRDSPWYDSATLYRQRAAGDWSGAIDDVIAALRQRFAANDLPLF